MAKKEIKSEPVKPTPVISSEFIKVKTRSMNPKTNGFYEIIMDKEDYNALSRKYYFYVNKNSKGELTAHACELIGGQVNMRDRKTLSRFILGMDSGEYKNHVVKYINGNSLDLRKNNLNIVSRCEIQLNHPGRKKNNGLPKGVYMTNSGGYVAHIAAMGKSKHLGTYDTPEEAGAAYLAAKKEVEKILKQ